MTCVRNTLAPIVVAALHAAATLAEAQRSAADDMLLAGRVAAAESAYFADARRAPRSPEARLALGNYLAARGAWRIGAVLLEEARYFGGAPRMVAVHLAPLYHRLGDWSALAALPASPLSQAERARVDFLVRNPPRVRGPDSLVVPFLPPAGSEGLGRILLTIGNDTVEATLDPSVSGVVLDVGWLGRAGTQRFGGRGTSAERSVGIARELRLGALVFTNIPLSYRALGGARRGRVGLDFIGRLAPSFDSQLGRMTLRKSGRLSLDRGANRLPALILPTGAYVVERELMRLDAPRARSVLGARWTWDGRRGEVRRDRPGR